MVVALGHEAGPGCSATTLSSPTACARRAGSGIGEKLWRMPLGPKYDKLMDSEDRPT